MYDSIVSAYEFLAKGGVVMLFIIASSIVAIVLFIERLIVFRHERTRSQRLIEPLIEAIKLGQFERAFTLCDEHRGCMARIAARRSPNATLRATISFRQLATRGMSPRSISTAECRRSAPFRRYHHCSGSWARSRG